MSPSVNERPDLCDALRHQAAEDAAAGADEQVNVGLLRENAGMLPGMLPARLRGQPGMLLP